MIKIPIIQFSIRTMLLCLAIVAIVLAIHLRIVNKRKQMLDYITNSHGFYNEYVDPFGPRPKVKTSWSKHYENKISSISRFRLTLGDKSISYINLCHGNFDWSFRQEIAELFPEADVVPEDPKHYLSKTPSEQKIDLTDN